MRYNDIVVTDKWSDHTVQLTVNKLLDKQVTVQPAVILTSLYSNMT